MKHRATSARQDHKRAAIALLLAQGESYRAIARKVKTGHEQIVNVARDQHAEIEKRKARFIAQAEYNAELAAQVLTDALESGKVSARDAVPIYGVSIDKAQLLRGDASLVVEHRHAHIHVDAMADFNARYAALPKRATVVEAETVENVETGLTARAAASKTASEPASESSP